MSSHSRPLDRAHACDNDTSQAVDHQREAGPPRCLPVLLRYRDHWD